MQRSLLQNSLLKCWCYCSVAQSWLTLGDPMDYSIPGLSVPQRLPKFAQVHVHCISDAIQPSHPPTSSSPFALKCFPASEIFPMISCWYNWYISLWRSTQIVCILYIVEIMLSVNIKMVLLGNNVFYEQSF